MENYTKEQLKVMLQFGISIDYYTNEYGREHIKGVMRNDGTDIPLTEIHIANDKHAYACKECGCIFQSKNLATRNLFDTNDPKTDNCNSQHSGDMLIQICRCDPIV